MKVRWICRLTLLGMALLAASACAQEPVSRKDQYRIQNGVLWQGKEATTLLGIETPDLAAPGANLDSYVPVLNRLSSVGADSLCFELRGVSADGKSLAPEVLPTIKGMIGQAMWRGMGVVCRVFAAGSPEEPAYRKAVIKTAAEALKAEKRAVYWIDGPDAEALVAEFRKAAPQLVVAAEEGGDVDVVASMPEGKTERSVIVLGQIPPRELRDSVSCLLPGADASFDAFEKAMADPSELQPWTPDNSMLSEQEKAEGFISLFDGKTLNGWWMRGSNKDGFRVNDGCIEWVSPGAYGLLTHDRYDNFVLRLEWKIKDRGNSGVFIRAPRINRCSKVGMEIQIMGDAGDAPVKDTTGAVYDVVPPKVNAGKPAGEWNAYEIMVNGPHLKITLNGQVVQDLNLDENEELKYRLRNGFIGLQDHGGYAAFRNIRVKRL